MVVSIANLDLSFDMFIAMLGARDTSVYQTHTNGTIVVAISLPTTMILSKINKWVWVGITFLKFQKNIFMSLLS